MTKIEIQFTQSLKKPIEYLGMAIPRQGETMQIDGQNWLVRYVIHIPAIAMCQTGKVIIKVI